jgi:hypothetical protein
LWQNSENPSSPAEDWGKLLGDVAAVSALLDRPQVRPAELAHQDRTCRQARRANANRTCGFPASGSPIIFFSRLVP